MDLKRFWRLVRDGLVHPRKMWEDYFSQERGWRETAVQLILPLILLTALIVPALSSLFGAPQVLGAETFGLRGFASGILGTTIAMVAMGAITGFTAKWFSDRASFERGFAAVSVTSVPAFAADVVGTVPLVGWVVEITGSIVSILFLYQVIPLALGVPRHRRVPHFVLTLTGAVAVGVALSLVFGGHPADSAPSLSQG